MFTLVVVELERLTVLGRGLKMACCVTIQGIPGVTFDFAISILSV